MAMSLDLKSLDLQQLKAVSPYKAAGAIALLLAIWMAWQGWQISAAYRLEAAAGVARTELADRLAPVAKRTIGQMEALRTRASVVSALQKGDLEGAKIAIKDGWKEAEAVELHAPDLDAPYADPAAFGYGKLGLLEAALDQRKIITRVIVDEGKPSLALAMPMLEGETITHLVYVRTPLAPLVGPVLAAAPEGAYVALRQGRYNMAQSGMSELANTAEAGAIELPDTAIRVVSAAPLALGGLFGLAGVGEFILAGLFVLLGIGLALAPKLRRAAIAGDASEQESEAGGQTIAQLQQSGALATPVTVEAKPAVRRPADAANQLPLDRGIFRAYDIRGVVGKNLDPNIARLIGQAVGSMMHERNVKTVVVGRDGRVSSAALANALISGLRLAGREVMDLGEVPTPIVYFGTFHLRAGSCVMVTGSHNPPDYNGFKVVVDGDTLSGEAIQQLYGRIVENRLHKTETPGPLGARNIIPDYIRRIADDIQIERRLRVVVDCGNSVPGLVVPQLMEAIGADVEPLFCDVDGTFPNHHPDPSDPHNLSDLIQVVKRTGADLGLAFDGDGDRLGVVTPSGEMIYPDRLLMLFAADVLERNPGAAIIYDVKCTSNLTTHILRHGGSPLMWKTGHSLIKAKMKETEAELAGEMSGHFFFRERWYGFDDAMYAAARLLEILAALPDNADAVFASLPKGVSTPELKIPVEEGSQHAFVERFVAAAKFEGARISTIDGLRADWPDGWGLVRASNTTPMLVLRFDARDQAALERVQGLFRAQLMALEPGLSLPF